jgi:hypothetical protein
MACGNLKDASGEGLTAMNVFIYAAVVLLAVCTSGAFMLWLSVDHFEGSDDAESGIAIDNEFDDF